MSRRSKGSGYLFKVGAKYKFEFKVNGKRFKRTLKATNKKDAEVESKKLLEESEALNKEQFIEKVAKARGIDTSLIKLEDAWSYYINSANRRNPSEATLVNYERYWNKFKCWAIEEKIDAVEKVTPQIASKYMNWLLESSSIKGQSYNKVKNFLKSFYTTLNHGTSRKNPFENINNRESEASDKQGLSQEQLEVILELADKDMQTLICIGAYTGLRLADAARLRWSDVDLENRSISVIPQKTKRKNKRVTIPIHSRLLKVLVSLESESDYVLPEYVQIYDKNRSALSRKFKYLCESADIVTEKKVKGAKNESIIGFHSLRYCFVSECAKAGIPLFVVQQIVGHGSPAITRHYTQIDSNTVKTHMKKLETSSIGVKKVESKPDKLSEVLKLIESMNQDNWQDIRKEILNHE